MPMMGFFNLYQISLTTGIWKFLFLLHCDLAKLRNISDCSLLISHYTSTQYNYDVNTAWAIGDENNIN